MGLLQQYFLENFIIFRRKSMEGSVEGSPPSSMWMVKAAELFPKPALEKEDDKLIVPFTELAGESVKYLGQTDDGALALSNYRLFLFKNSTASETSVPLGLIESAQGRDLFHLIVNCKDASTVKCSFTTSEQCSEWQRRITLSVGVPENLEALFAFPFHAWASELPSLNQDNEWSGRLQRSGNYDDDFRKEVERLQFDLQGAWRISHANAEFKLCPSYPRMLLVPACISDDTLQNVASFRSSRRIPAVVWRHQKTGAVIARCSQPEVGWLGWRNSKDEQLLKALSDACSFDKGTTVQETRTRNDSTTSNESSPPSPEGSHEEVNMDEPKKILIVDARSYTSAVTNRARGGGCECPEYYPSAEIQFMSLGNIHVIRKSFHALRQLCASQPDIPNWLGLLERTTWLQHMSGLLAASVVVSHAVERNGRPVLVHCSDGWDRTPQIVATAQLCLDPYYRTVEGFRILVEREWLNFGHKFADRCGHGPDSDETNERCPVFLQWLDCVHQIHRQFPCSFEFDMGFLIKLAQHSHSCLFGTFLCNTVKERQENTIPDRTFSVWPFLSGPMYKNHLYVPNRERVLWPAHNVRDLALWAEVYLGSWGGNQNSSDYPTNSNDSVNNSQEITSSMTKTRSYGDLITGLNQGGLTRRSSDPNMSVETNMLNALNLSEEDSIDSNVSSDRETSPDLIERTIATMIHDTTKKVQNLTHELNQSDEELENSMRNTKKDNFNLDITDAVTSDYDMNDKNNEISSLFDENHISTTINSLTNFTYHPFVSEPDHAKSLCENNAIEVKEEAVEEEDENNLDGVQQLLFNGGDAVDGIVTKMNEINIVYGTDMLQSVDLNDKTTTSTPNPSPTTTNNLWHGSIEKSTDTLVPLDQYQPRVLDENEAIATNLMQDSISLEIARSNNFDEDLKCVTGNVLTINTGDSNGCDLFSNSDCDKEKPKENLVNGEVEQKFQNSVAKQSIDIRLKDLPDVHGFSNNINNNNNNNNNSNSMNFNHNHNKIKNINNYMNIMDESIIMQPQYQQLEINGKEPQNQQQQQPQPHPIPLPLQRRRRNSSNSKPDLSPNKFNNGSISPSATNSRFSTPGARSLPLTPPSAPFVVERPPVALSCPDGLAHGLSEQNLRLQQIVYEHKLREEALQRELYATRLALLKKTCHNCNNQQFPNEEQTSMVDSMIENASVGSWEAVDERSGPSSGANSSQQFTNSVLWVPDHAVSRCTNCKFEFWLGRRKHHCRSCGQIFCADCSEFWAPLPDEKLFQPVRLCRTCYALQNQQQPNQMLTNSNSTLTNSSNFVSTNNDSSSIITAIKQHNNPSTLEPCKHAACGPTTNERGSFKATTATN